MNAVCRNWSEKIAFCGGRYATLWCMQPRLNLWYSIFRVLIIIYPLFSFFSTRVLCFLNHPCFCGILLSLFSRFDPVLFFAAVYLPFSSTSLLQGMVCDPYANYVVQKIIDVADQEQRQTIILEIKTHAAQLKRWVSSPPTWNLSVRVAKLFDSGNIR